MASATTRTGAISEFRRTPRRQRRRTVPTRRPTRIRGSARSAAATRIAGAGTAHQRSRWSTGVWPPRGSRAEWILSSPHSCASWACSSGESGRRRRPRTEGELGPIAAALAANGWFAIRGQPRVEHEVGERVRYDRRGRTAAKRPHNVQSSRRGVRASAGRVIAEGAADAGGSGISGSAQTFASCGRSWRSVAARVLYVDDAQCGQAASIS